jgi:hypothetical protein
MRHIESNLQQSCVTWFRLQYPKLSWLLFAVPNGGGRRKVEAAIMRVEGVMPGVSDLLLLVPSCGFHALCIEMKTSTGRQSEAQKNWQKSVEEFGYLYVVCRSFEEFASAVNHYLIDK